MADFLRCKDCKHDKGKCIGVSRRSSHKNCFEPKFMTNADRIRAMSDEELVKLFGHNSICDYVQDHSGKHCEKHGSCDGCLLEWLKQPAEVKDNA